MNDKISNTFLHGADYNYEQWLDYPEILEKDFEYMKKSHCNVMTIGVFSWSMLEPEEGQYNFEWLDDLFEKLHKNGLKAILATPSGSKPVWLSELYPEVCRVDKNGHREPHGYRHNHCRTSPVYREKTRKINTLLAERYKDHPALLMWHVSNEYNGLPCYCDLCLGEFREWLKKRYKTIDNLNKAWWTTFWSHRYTDWSQIIPVDESIHGLMLDWQRFTSDQTLDFFIDEYSPLRKITPNVPITTNFMKPNVGLDYWQFAQHVDIVSWDNYPQWHLEQDEWKEGVRTSFYHDLFRSMKDRPFMMMESSPNVTNWQPLSISKKPNMHLLSSLQAIAHGSDTVQYFQWRQSRGGSEKFHSAVIGHSSRTDTKVFKDVSEVGRILKEIEEVMGSKTHAEVAILYDFQTEWALGNAQMPRNIDKCYKERCMTHYSAFWKMGISVDIKDSTYCDFSRYKIIIAPMLYMLRGEVVSRLEDYVNQGGTLVTTYLSGIVDSSDLCYLGGFPGPLRRLLGLWIEETDTLDDFQRKTLTFTFPDTTQKSRPFQVKHYADVVHLEAAGIVGVFDESESLDSPAITVNKSGNGRAFYLASRNEDDFYPEFYRHLIGDQEITPFLFLDLPQGVTVQYRRNKEHLFIFFMNFTSQSCFLKLPQTLFLSSSLTFSLKGAVDMITKEQISEDFQLSAYGIRVVKCLLR